MKKIILIATISLVISCKDKKATETTKPIVQTPKIEEKEVKTELYGSWVGDFVAEEFDKTQNISYSNKLNLSIKKITPRQVLGQSIVAGNSRILLGKFSTNGNTTTYVLNEPGNDKYDGVFTFEVKKDTLIGTWIANNKKVAVTKRNYKLVKQKFVYNPKNILQEYEEDGSFIDYENPKETKEKYYVGDSTYVETVNVYRMASDMITKINASVSVLKEKDLKNLKKLDLEIIRNTIYARHGYTFKKRTYRQFFDPVDWYVPISNSVEADLTPVEKDNIVLLKRFEKYAEDNYDTFGR